MVQNQNIHYGRSGARAGIWRGGADAAVIGQLAAGFEAKNPGLKVKQVPVTSSGDQRGGSRGRAGGRRSGPTMSSIIAGSTTGSR